MTPIEITAAILLGLLIVAWVITHYYDPRIEFEVW